MNKRQDLPELVLSSPDRYFREVRESGKALPKVYGELLHHSSGCYSAEMRIKAANRRTEEKLQTAEKLSVLANALRDYPYPMEELTKAWKTVLFNQFHDIMAGTSIRSACEDALQEYGYAATIADHAANGALQRLTWSIDIPKEEGMRPLVVFNPNAFEAKLPVEVEMVTPKPHTVLLDEEDHVIPYQLVQSEAACNGRSRMVFVAELPALGYRVYRLAIREDMENPQQEADTALALENAFVSLTMDEATGGIAALENKADGTQFFKAPAAIPVVIDDPSDTWSHGVYQFDREAGSFALERMFCLESGSVRKVTRAIYRYGKSTLQQDFILYRALPQVYVRVRVDWQEQQKMLKLRFPMQLNYLRCSYEIPYGVVGREPNGQEFPMEKFMDLEGTNPGMETAIAGLSILTDTRSACSTLNQEAYLTVLRSPIFAHHTPYVPDENITYDYMDQGKSEFTYALYPHTGSWEQSQTGELSQTMLAKPIALFETYHPGVLPQKASFASVSTSQVQLTVLKAAEDGKGVVVRLRETTGQPARAEVALPFLSATKTLTFTPWEIKTLRVDGDTWTETNLLELE